MPRERWARMSHAACHSRLCCAKHVLPILTQAVASFGSVRRLALPPPNSCSSSLSTANARSLLHSRARRRASPHPASPAGIPSVGCRVAATCLGFLLRSAALSLREIRIRGRCEWCQYQVGGTSHDVGNEASKKDSRDYLAGACRTWDQL